jgi:lysophospholipase L1-like esterase
MLKYLHLVLIAVFCSSAFSSCSQPTDKPFQKEIDEFKKEDRKSFPPKDAILFVGSSSFTKWKDVQSYFPGYVIINRGFGGSGLNDVIGYADSIIIPYHPRQVVIYCGDNDIAAGASAQEVLKRVTRLFTVVRRQLPDANILFVSIKPSPSRASFMPVVEEANSLVRQFLSAHPKTGFVDVYHPMLGKDGKPRPELFVEDNLHMNAEGYKIWRDVMKPYLIR